VLLQSRYTPCKGKSIAFQVLIIAFALTGRKPKHSSTQGVALGWVLIGLSGRWSATFGSDRYFSKLYRTPIILYSSFYSSIRLFFQLELCAEEVSKIST
jgi:hypothetical protein